MKNRTRLAAGLLAAACLTSIPVAAMASTDTPSALRAEASSVAEDQRGQEGGRSHRVNGGPKHEWPFCRGPIPKGLEVGSEMVNGGPKHEWPFSICNPRMPRP